MIWQLIGVLFLIVVLMGSGAFVQSKFKWPWK